MHENSGYEFATLRNLSCDDISNLEKKITQDSGKEIILLAFERKICP